MKVRIINTNEHQVQTQQTDVNKDPQCSPSDSFHPKNIKQNQSDINPHGVDIPHRAVTAMTIM